MKRLPIRQQDRREFVRLTASIGGTLLLPGSLLPGCKTTGAESAALDERSLRAQQRAVGASALSALPKRGNVVTDTKNAQLYAKAFRYLQSTEEGKKAWRTMAEVHLNACPHGNWFFLPWHRAYLFYFEDMIRSVLDEMGEADANSFALPYWDWTSHPSLPPVAMQESGIYWNERSQESVGGQTIGDDYVGPEVIKRIFQAKDFDTFGGGRATDPRGGSGPGGYGMLESVPHNRVHVWVGGPSGTMATFLSPLDPVFWLHHCNVDRLWAKWQKQQRDAGLSDVPRNGIFQSIKAKHWLRYDLTRGQCYYDPERREAVPVPETRGLIVQNVLDYAELGYVYDDVPAFQSMSLADAELSWQPSYEAKLDVPVKRIFEYPNAKGITFALDSEPMAGRDSTGADRTVGDIIRRFEANKGSRQLGFTLKAKNVPRPTDPKASLHFYVNWRSNRRPTGADHDKHYLGTFTFFVDPAHAHHMTSADLHFDLASALRQTSIEISNQGNVFVSVFVDSRHDFPNDLKQKLKEMALEAEYFEV